MKPNITLEPNPLYYPLEKGLYEVAPLLNTLGKDFGNGAMDARIFQIDGDFAAARANKIECRRERLSKYYCKAGFTPELERALAKLLIEKFSTEYPQIFARSVDKIECRHTGDVLEFDTEYRLRDTSVYTDLLDALANQVQEDIVLVSRDREKNDRLSFLHLCAPSHWSPEEKCGQNFISVHAPIPGIEKINKAAASLVDAMINKGPYVRFVWSFVTDQRLNHHPEPPAGIDAAAWKGRNFNADDKECPFHLRVERQVVYGMPEVESSMFTIRISFLSGAAIKADPKKRDLLLSSLASMTPESRVYKGVSHCYDELTSWLKQ